jgi:putative NIF3 family GTP cyclohydrolase 1 type 2
MLDRRDVVLADSRRVAKSVMESDWSWSPQRVKDALVVTGKGQIQQMKSSGQLSVFVAGDYPTSDYDAIHSAIEGLDSIWGNPFCQRSS